VGSPDVFAEDNAGPYRLSIVLRPPRVIPGVTDVEVRTETPGVDSITITPVPLTGEAANHPPVPDTMARPSKDAQFFTGHLWIMATGSWQVRFVVHGQQGQGFLSIPLPATAMSTQKMHAGLGMVLAIPSALLLLGLVSIVGAAASRATLAPGERASASDVRRGRIAIGVATAVLVAIVLLGNLWWNAEAAAYAGHIFKPLQMSTTLEGHMLDLKLRDPGWLKWRGMDDFIPDHNHLMHLYLVRWPQMDVVFHLHPQPTGIGDFQLALPSMPAGNYHLYADVVHANGFPETLVSQAVLPQITGHSLTGDDAEGESRPVEASEPTAVAIEQRFRLPDGYTMVWKMPESLAPRVPESFQFELIDPNGKMPGDMALYMGMLGHAAFIKTDGTVFAHIHPDGTMAMAAYMMANPQEQMNGATNPGAMNMGKMPGMDTSNTELPNSVSFPYGFPSPGEYRIFVQMKHGGTIETGIFDADVRTTKP
jgi:hypothetical protein